LLDGGEPKWVLNLEYFRGRPFGGCYVTTSNVGRDEKN
jgi:hypothetical protein